MAAHPTRTVKWDVVHFKLAAACDAVLTLRRGKKHAYAACGISGAGSCHAADNRPPFLRGPMRSIPRKIPFDLLSS